MNKIKPNSFVKLSNFTTWRVGGEAEWLAEPKNLDEIKQLIAWAQAERLSCQIIGAGSNLLISDSGLQGLTICLRKFNGSFIDNETGSIEALSGEPIPSLSRKAAQEGLHGLEWSIGIPGTAGGAAVMNAGAQGGCVADWIQAVKVLPLKGGEVFEINKEDLEYSYRQSILQREDLLVISARFQLEPGQNPKELNQKTNQNLNYRTTTQPYHLPSCGSVFRNPEKDKAGRMIENLGLKGLRIGGAEISTTHANFIVNTGNATAKDIKELIAVIQKKVQDTHGVLLHQEVKELGFDRKD